MDYFLANVYYFFHGLPRRLEVIWDDITHMDPVLFVLYSILILCLVFIVILFRARYGGGTKRGWATYGEQKAILSQLVNEETERVISSKLTCITEKDKNDIFVQKYLEQAKLYRESLKEVLTTEQLAVRPRFSDKFDALMYNGYLLNKVASFSGSNSVSSSDTDINAMEQISVIDLTPRDGKDSRELFEESKFRAMAFRDEIVKRFTEVKGIEMFMLCYFIEHGAVAESIPIENVEYDDMLREMVCKWVFSYNISQYVRSPYFINPNKRSGGCIEVYYMDSISSVKDSRARQIEYMKKLGKIH